MSIQSLLAEMKEEMEKQGVIVEQIYPTARGFYVSGFSQEGYTERNFTIVRGENVSD